MKKTIIYLIIFTSILLTMFLWKESDSLSLHKKIDDDKLANFFTAFAGIIVSVSLYYLYRQLKEMKSSYLPDLYLNYTEFKVNVQSGPEIFNQKPWVKVLNIENGNTSEMNSTFRLSNIGLGASKNISIKWKYDIDEVKKIFNDKFQYMPIIITESQHLDFLEANGTIPINIPQFYFNCCAPEYNFNASNHQEMADKLLKGLPLKPEIIVEVKYQDIQNEYYSRKFNLEIMPINSILKIKFKTI